MNRMKYLLLIHGSFEKWKSYSADQQRAITGEFLKFADYLKANNALIDGDPCGDRSFRINSAENCKQSTPLSPSTSDMVTGFFILSCASEEEALNHVTKCPSFKYEESVELVPLIDVGGKLI